MGIGAKRGKSVVAVIIRLDGVQVTLHRPKRTEPAQPQRGGEDPEHRHPRHPVQLGADPIKAGKLLRRITQIDARHADHYASEDRASEAVPEAGV